MAEGVRSLSREDVLECLLQQAEKDCDSFALMYAKERRAHRQTRNELMQVQLVARELRKQNRALRKRNIKRRLDFSENE